MSQGIASESVTVVVPARNAAATLAATIASLVGQSVGPPRVLVVDDGSEDETAAIARAAGAERLLTGPGCGPGAARNVGILAATTPLIAFCDADDLWPPQRLEVDLPRFAEDPELEVLLGRTRFQAADSHLLQNLRFPEENPIIGTPHFGAATMRRDVFSRIGLIDAAIRHEDYEWFMRARDLRVCMSTHPSLSLIYCLRADSRSRSNPPSPVDLIAVLHRSVQRRRNASPSQQV